MAVAGKKQRRRTPQTVPLGERLKMAAIAARRQADLLSQEDERAALLAKAKEFELAYLVNSSLSVSH